MRVPVTVAGLLVAALPMVLVAPSAAHAGKPATAGKAPDHFHDTWTEAWPCWSDAPAEPGGEPEPDYVLTYSGDVRGVTAFRTTGRNDVAGFHDTVHGTETWTLVAAGEEHTLTHVFNSSFRDQSVVDEGTTLLITSHPHTTARHRTRRHRTRRHRPTSRTDPVPRRAAGGGPSPSPADGRPARGCSPRSRPAPR